jgi:hypothetical protein
MSAATGGGFLFPVCVRPERVVELLRHLSGDGSKVRIEQTVLEAARRLGLVEPDGAGRPAPTGAGRAVAECDCARPLADFVANVEPFATVMGVLRARGNLLREDILKIVGEAGYSDPWEALGCVLYWLIYLGLADYDSAAGILRPLAF